MPVFDSRQGLLPGPREGFKDRPSAANFEKEDVFYCAPRDMMERPSASNFEKEDVFYCAPRDMMDRPSTCNFERQDIFYCAPRNYRTSGLRLDRVPGDLGDMSEDSFQSTEYHPSPTPSVRSLSSDAVESKAFSFVPRTRSNYSESMRSLSDSELTSSAPETSPKRLPESYSDSQAEEYMPEQRLISPGTQIRLKDTKQAYLKEIVNSEIRSNAKTTAPIAFTRGGLSPREVYLRRTLNAEVKQMGWRKEIHRAIEQRGRSMFLKKCAVEEIKQITRKDHLMKDIRERFQRAEDKAKVLDSIHARRALMCYFERNPRVLERKACAHMIKRMKRSPKQVYWKFLSQQDCVDEVLMRQEAEEEELLESESDTESVVFHGEQIGHPFYETMDFRDRKIARRRQISQMLEHKENKRLVLKELKQRAMSKEVGRLKRRRGNVILAMHEMTMEAKRQRNNNDNQLSLDGIEKSLGQVIHDDLTQSLIKSVNKGARSGVERITRRRAKSVHAHFIQKDSLAVHDKHTPTVVPHSESSQNWFRQHYLRMEVNRQIRTMSPGHAPMPDHMNVSDWTTSSEHYQRSEQEAREPALPAPKEFFVRTIVNNILGRSSRRSSRKLFLLARHIAMPEQAYLKLKVNEVIKKIGLVKERQEIRARKRLINEEIVNRGNKAALNRHILFLARAIQTKMGIFEPERRAPPALDMSLLNAMDDQQAHMEIKQRQLKKHVLMEIKVAGLKNRVCHEIRRIAMRKEVNMLRLRRGDILIQMENIRSVNTRMSSKALLNAGQPLSKQLYLKQQVNQAVLQRGKQQQLKQLVHETIVQRARKAAVCQEIKTRQRQIELKAEVAQIIQARGDKMRLMNELRRWSLKRRLARAAGRCQSFIPPLTTIEEQAHQSIRRIKTELIDAKRRKENLREVAKAFQQIGHARKCRKEINQIITTHRQMGEVVLEIKTRGQTVRNKDRMLEELEEKFAQFNALGEFNALGAQKAKKVQLDDWSWREQNRRLHDDLTKHFEQKDEAERRQTERFAIHEGGRPIDRYQNMPVARQMFLKMEVNRHFKQRGLKIEMHRELLMRFRVVDLKQRICEEVIRHARMQLCKRQVRMTMSQRALKAQVMNDIFTGRVPILCPPSVDISGMFNGVATDEYSVWKREKLLKFEVAQEETHRFLASKPSTSMVAELAKINKAQILRKRGMLNELRTKQMERRMLKALEERAETKRRKMKLDQFVPLEDVEVVQGPLGRTHFTKFGEFQEEISRIREWDLVNEAIRARAAREKVSKMLALRAKVVRLKAKLNMELRVRVNKAKCVYAIWERAQARKHHSMVCEELLQRTRHSRCVYEIQHGMYYLRKVAKPVEFSPVVIIKQQLHKKRVNTVVRQAGLKIELNQELLDRQATCDRKHRVTEEIKIRARKVKICREIRRNAHQTLRSHVEQWAETKTQYSWCVDELKQRCRHLEVVKEIKTRQKQVHWKAQTCIVIKQGGHKIRVNKEIRQIARQKFLKKQGGLKCRTNKEIRQLRVIATIQRQKQLKAKCCLHIKQIAEAKINKRRVNCVVKQTGLKARCNQQIRSRRHVMKSQFLTSKIANYFSIGNPPRLYSQQAVLTHPELARPAIDPSKRRRRSRDVDMNEAWSTKLEESSRAEGQEDAGVVVTYPEHENAFAFEHPQLFDDLECVYGETFSEKGLAVMKLVESVTKVSERKEKQEVTIRALSAEIEQQKSDFKQFSTRMVEDKAKLYTDLDKLKAENDRLRQLKQDQQDEKRRKLIQQAQEKVERRQAQQAAGPLKRMDSLKRMGSLVGNKLAEKLHIRVQESQHQQSARPMQDPISKQQATQFQMVELNNGKRVHHYPRAQNNQQQNRQLFF